MKIQTTTRDRRSERGQSFLLVVAGMFTILALAAFAIDIASLYAAKSEAQKAADAAALAAVKTFAMSSSTSGTGAGDTPADLCVDNTPGKMANAMASAAAAANTVGGAAAAITNLTCTLGNTQNPQVSVTVGRTDLPLYFSRVFGNKIATVNATAKAEAYNNSSATGAAVQTGSVKPWLVPNCQGTTPANCTGTPNYFFLAGVPNTPSNYLGLRVGLVPYGGAAGGVTNPIMYYVADMPSPDHPDICPSTSAVSCGAVGGGGYPDDISCANRSQMKCGDQVQVSDSNFVLTTPATTGQATQCLIHANGPAIGDGQDDISITGPPVVITKDFGNPNTSIGNGTVISRSDSVVTVPVFNFTTDPCNPGAKTCAPTTETVIGFLELAIRRADATGIVRTVVVNAVGCNASGGPLVSGGGVSPVPVRLIQ